MYVINQQEKQMPWPCSMTLITPSVVIIKSADRKMVKSLDALPKKERQLGRWLARNVINTKQKIVLGAKSKNGKSRRVKKTGNSNWQMNYINL